MAKAQESKIANNFISPMDDFFKILVCGGRNFGVSIEEIRFIVEKLEKIISEFPDTAILIINGGATGVDTIAKNFAEEKQIPYITFPAQWDKYGKFAGPIRNQQMLEMNPNLVLAFRGGTGTKNMINLAKTKNIKTMIFE